MRSPKPSLVITNPSIEPLTLADVRDGFLHAIDDTDENAFITLLIKAARLQAEKFMGRKLITQTVAEYWDDFPCDGILEFAHPAQSVTSLSYNDTNGAAQSITVASDCYTDLKFITPKIISKTSFPSTLGEGFNNVTLLYVAGFGSSATDVPEDIRQAMRLMIGRMYECRDEHYRQAMSTASELLMTPYRVRFVS